MKVSIKDFGIPMNVKNTGIEFEIRNPKGKHLGDLVLTNTKFVWCKGKTTLENGKKMTWPEFIELMEKR